MFLNCSYKFIYLSLILVCIRNVESARCGGYSTCGECMQDFSCVWCQDKQYYSAPRCISRDSPTTCVSTVDVSSSMTVVSDLPLELVSGSFTQVTPQEVNLYLRPGKPVNISLTVGHAENFPVDLYFLMDLSWSMRTSRDVLTKVTQDIIQAINQKSDDVKLGFGSFIDKNVPPFTSAISEFNCAPDNPNCSPPYSFYHQQRLENISPEDFKKSVMEAPLAGNVDDPEGSLDALLQSMVCVDRIGWREDSRKLILLFTDRDFHFAMDGKLAGILQENDGLCHLNDTGNGSGYYTKGAIQDYPSVGMISRIAQENNFIILFAVPQEYKQVYQGMVDMIPGSSVDILSKDASNIVEIVKTKYDQITTQMRLSPGYNKNIKTRLFSSCSGATLEERSECTDIKIGVPIQFTLEVTSNTCNFEKIELPIALIGLTDKMIINIYPQCKCPCEQVETGISEACNNNGKLVCGACQCNQNHYGRLCQCYGNNMDIQSGEELCQKTAGGPVCSGRGECTCGICTCHTDTRGIISGTFCECDNWTCPKTRDGLLCNGHGLCECGSCTCDPGWSGQLCDCPTQDTMCVSPYDGEVCSGHGHCDCGRCVCHEVEQGVGIYTGRYCERNPVSGFGACEEVRECVECLNFQSEEQEDDCSKCMFQTNIIEMNTTNIIVNEGVTICSFVNKNKCSYSFTLGLNLQGVPVVNLISRNGKVEVCGTPLAIGLGIGAGVAVIVIGILTLLAYKLCIEINDRREYAKFERDLDMAKSAVNQMPNEIYKSPITKFQNPTYGK